MDFLESILTNSCPSLHVIKKPISHPTILLLLLYWTLDLSISFFRNLLAIHMYTRTHTHAYIHIYEPFSPILTFWNFCVSLYIWIFYQNNRMLSHALDPMCVKSFTTQFSFCCPLHIYHFWLRLVLGVYSTWHQTALHSLNGYVCMYASMHVYNNWR